MKKWKKLLIPLGITVVLIGGLVMFNPFTGKDEPIHKDEQDRVAQYLVDHYELANGDGIKTIEFIEFEKNNMTGTWRITAKINKKYDISLKENKLKDQLRSSNYSPKEFKMRNVNHTQNVSNIKIIYYGGEK